MREGGRAFARASRKSAIILALYLGTEPLVGPIDTPTRKAVVFAMFLDTDILDEQGRLVFSLLNAFAISGYPILLFDCLPAERLGRYGLMAKSLPGLSL